MIVYYSGPTEFTHKFVGELGQPSTRLPHSIKESQEILMDEEFILFCPTYERKLIRGPESGRMTYIPRQVAAFLSSKENRTHLVGVVGFGNINFGQDFARAADDISSRTGVPVLGRVELSGTTEDIENYKEGLVQFWLNR